jgi:hypothetical protein
MVQLDRFRWLTVGKRGHTLKLIGLGLYLESRFQVTPHRTPPFPTNHQPRIVSFLIFLHTDIICINMSQLYTRTQKERKLSSSENPFILCLRKQTLATGNHCNLETHEHSYASRFSPSTRNMDRRHASGVGGNRGSMLLRVPSC